jgi:uncharacterized membrane protein
MDISNLNRRAERVSDIFHLLAMLVAVVGGFAAVVAIVSAITSGLGERVVWGIGIAIYTVLAWAAIQLSSLVAGYIHSRTISDS